MFNYCLKLFKIRIFFLTHQAGSENKKSTRSASTRTRTLSTRLQHSQWETIHWSQYEIRSRTKMV